MEMIKADPIGGPVSNRDSCWDDKGKTIVSHICVSYNSWFVTSIQFGYIENGTLVMSAKYGSSLGNNFRVVKLKHNEFVTGLSAVKMITMGPIGHSCTGSGCFEWDETPHDIISHINVSFNKHGVTSIQFGYVENGAVVLSETYGSSSSVCSRRILRLNHETEFVTGIHGEVYNGYISSLAFQTNERTHFAVHWTFDSAEDGLEKVEFHSGILEGREFGGFFGTCDHAQLKSIGFYVRLLVPSTSS
ncbi:Jacalin-like lectin domain-containing protein [Hirschfeldia incana]|nr:Jacalin-like lectin domain-containing protein [Hirschfeldia incana]